MTPLKGARSRHGVQCVRSFPIALKGVDASGAPCPNHEGGDAARHDQARQVSARPAVVSTVLGDVSAATPS